MFRTHRTLTVLALAAVLGACGGGSQDVPPAAGATPGAATAGPGDAGTPGAVDDPADDISGALPSPVALPTLSDKAVTTESGLQYEDVVVGAGDEATANMIVTIHYSLFLEDGTRVDSSVERGEPVTFLLGDKQAMPGWDEGIVGMRTGGRRMLICPPELAFGVEGHPPQMPPNATVISDVELVAVRPAPEVPERPAEVEAYTTTDSGLEYAILQPGSGGLAEGEDTVAVNYTGWLEDGTMFDSSLKRGQPLVFMLGVGEVIDGWDEGIAGMQVGEKRQLRVPGKLGYGAAGSPPKIPPNATLVFDVELLEIR